MVFLLPSLASGETMEDLVYRDGLYYKKFTNVPFTGKTTGEIQGTFRNGEKDGPWVEYHDNGQLSWKATYKNGKLDGPSVSSHDNGQVFRERNYKNGKLDGPWVRYHDNGQLRWEGTVKDGKREGPWVYYNEDGAVDERYTGIYRDGVRVE